MVIGKGLHLVLETSLNQAPGLSGLIATEMIVRQPRLY